jgi:hypothetical protein
VIYLFDLIIIIPITQVAWIIDIQIAEEAGDPQLADFVDGEFLKPQVNKCVANFLIENWCVCVCVLIEQIID